MSFPFMSVDAAGSYNIASLIQCNSLTERPKRTLLIRNMNFIYEIESFNGEINLFII